MFRPVPTLLGLAVASAAASGPAQEVSVSGEDCEVIRILEDGREVRSAVKATASDGSAASASARSGTGPSRSSASVSSSSRGGVSARAVSSATDSKGRTVTTTHDENGCTIVIDERGS